ncbi:hypothetical protein [uncultured Marinobacter sp.]|uniref:hypothetical protein n=1 Tax=uncultured Marinobacter sp. TaxID=187379 RepID=UPI00261BAEF2|nr:hypothetical protein [uncultured Marinobacter sp.]MDX1597669.1 hypothetical protein [Marinobacter sp.]
MRELMQKALNALNQRKGAEGSVEHNRRSDQPGPTKQREDWGMSPEDALRVGTVARYK